MIPLVPPKQRDPAGPTQRWAASVIWLALLGGGIGLIALAIRHFRQEDRIERQPEPAQQSISQLFQKLQELTNAGHPGDDERFTRARNVETMILGRIADNEAGSALPVKLRKSPLDECTMRMAPDSRTLAIADEGHDGQDGKLILWDLESFSVRHVLKNESKGTHDLVFSPDGATLAWVGGDRIRICDPSTGTLLKELEFEPEDLWLDDVSVAYPPFAMDLLVLLPRAGQKESIQRWHLVDWRKRRAAGVWENVQRIACSPNGRIVALTRGTLSQTVEFWDSRLEKHLGTFGDDGTSIKVLRFSPDGRILAIGGGKRHRTPAKLLEPDPYLKLISLDSGHQQDLSSNFSTAISALSFSPDGQALAVQDVPYKVVFLDPGNGKVKKSLRLPYPLNQGQFSPGGSLFLGVRKPALGHDSSDPGYQIRAFRVPRLLGRE